MFGKSLVPGPARTESLHCPVQIVGCVETEVVKWATFVTPEAAALPRVLGDPSTCPVQKSVWRLPR